MTEKAKEFLEEYGLPFRESLPETLKRNYIVSAMNFLTSIIFYERDCRDKVWKDEKKLKRWKKAKKPIKEWELSHRNDDWLSIALAIKLSTDPELYFQFCELDDITKEAVELHQKAQKAKITYDEVAHEMDEWTNENGG